MKLAIVIVNYKTSALVADCLISLDAERAAFRDFVTLVTDNASGDGSVEQLTSTIESRGWSSWASVHALPRNGGFAFGNNAGIRAARERWDPELILLLNPDTVVRPGALRELVSFLDSNPQAAIGGPRLEDPDGTGQTSAFRWPSIASELDAGLRLGIVSRVLARWSVSPPVSPTPQRVDWLSGAALLVRSSVFDAVGLLDEGYFMYYEELDFCRSAARKGLSCWYVPAARIVHLVGQASGINRPRIAPSRRPAYWFESRRRYFSKQHGPSYAALADAVHIAGYALWRLRRRLQRRPDTDPPSFLSDLIRHSLRRSGA
jgi:N-acetylglucosaminyl-diphospho-decaprenol L-rhamnosyltransferase